MLTRILSPAEHLIETVTEYLVAEGSDYSDNLVIFPGKRPAHYLRKEIGVRAGRGYIPPHIVSMDTWIGELHDGSGESAPLDTLDAVSMLYDIHCALEQRLGAANFTSLDLFFPVGLRLFRDLEEMTIEMVSPQQVRSLGITATGVELGASHDRIMHIASYAERFYAAAERSGRATRALRYRSVAARMQTIPLDRFRRIILAGFFAFTASERLIVQSLAACEAAVALFQDGPYIDERLKHLGIRAERPVQPTHEQTISFLACPDVHGEAMAVGDLLNTDRALSAPDERTAVVLPSAETLFPLLRHALSGWDERDYNITLGYPLVRTPVFGFFQALAGLVTSIDGDRVYLPSYLAFVLHPYTKNIFFAGSAEITRILFHTIEDALGGDAAPAFLSLDAIERNEGMLGAASGRLAGEQHVLSPEVLRDHLHEIHARTILPFLQVASIRDFAEKCMALIEYLHDHTTAQFHPLFYPYVETVVHALEEVRLSALGAKSFHDGASYFSFFERYLATRSVPFEGTPLRGLQVMGMLETRAIQFDRVILLDANEDVLPDVRRDDSFIPARARQILGMPTHRDRDELAHYYFSVLVHGAKEVTICFLENDRRQRSRFVERLVWEQEKRQGRVSDISTCPQVRYAVRLDPAVPQPLAKCDSALQTINRLVFSASSLDRYLACPLRFYYHDIMHLRPREEKSGTLQRSDIGLVVHDVLKVYLHARSGKPLTTETLLPEAAVALVEEHFVRRFGERPFGAAYLQMRQIQRRLSDFIQHYLVPLAEQHVVSVLNAEDELRTLFHGYALQGRLDAAFAIDGQPVIVDFKTSANRKHYAIAFDKLDVGDRTTWRKSVGSLQLPIYRRLYADTKGIPVNEIDARYVMLGAAHVDEKIEIPLFDDLDDRMAGTIVIEELVRHILGEIADASIPFYPADDLKRSCPFCAYVSICGTQWIAQ